MTNESPTGHDTDQTTQSATDQRDEPTWIDMLEDLFDSAVDRQAELECELDNVEVELPLQSEPDTAHWEIDGTLQFRVDGIGGPLAEWLRWRDERLHQQHQQSDTHQPDSGQA